MIKIYYRPNKESVVEIVENFKPGAWVNVVDPTEDEINRLEKMLDVDGGLLRDALDPYEAPRLEQENGISYIFTRVSAVHSKEIETVTMLVVMGGNFLLTASGSKLHFLDKLINGEGAFSTVENNKLLLEIFLQVNKQYDSFLIDISKRVRGLKIKLEKINNKDLIQFIDLERVLNDFLSALMPMSSVLQRILDGRVASLNEDEHDLIEDILLSNGQLISLAKSTLKHVVNIRDTSSNIITHELNRIMKILTALTILLTIPTMIFSFYGMNVKLPNMNYPQMYIFIILFTSVIVILFLGIFKKNRWL